MRSPSICTLVAFLAFVVPEIAAQNPREELGKLPVCAQACITSAFASCECKILDFDCNHYNTSQIQDYLLKPGACGCKDFRSLSQGCTDTSCSGVTISAVRNTLENTCRKVPALETTLSSTSSTISGPASTDTLPSLFTSDLVGPSDSTTVNPIAPSAGSDDWSVIIGTGTPGVDTHTFGPPTRSIDIWAPTPTDLEILEPTSVFAKTETAQGIDVPFTLSTPFFSITTTTTTSSNPRPSDCIDRGYGVWRSNGTRAYNGTSICTGDLRVSGSGSDGTGTPVNATATRTGFLAPWNSTASQPSYSMPWYIGGVSAVRVQEGSWVASGMLFVLGWVMV